ncbi:hypothetical protein [Candidatus Enterococcus ikei]|uniref:Uncharacterized protein n=1 Tax=Candidatus Enterococcus ikei TaxID=2815326 RepID=A0ABS3H3E6_9ENTE|nr:hypothetical protein [Enterococcus sp. DIV0869a]MBO0441516.1 hypothetical protein [Enterococcus sp. DIV0869a]
MGLLDRQAKGRPSVQDIGESSRVVPKKNKGYSASQRKTIKVDPPVKNRVEILKSITDKKEYLLLEEIVDFYINNNLDEREQRIVKRMEEAKRE